MDPLIFYLLLKEEAFIIILLSLQRVVSLCCTEFFVHIFLSFKISDGILRIRTTVIYFDATEFVSVFFIVKGAKVLAHLSQRLIGELIGYPCSCVHQSSSSGVGAHNA